MTDAGARQSSPRRSKMGTGTVRRDLVRRSMTRAALPPRRSHLRHRLDEGLPQDVEAFHHAALEARLSCIDPEPARVEPGWRMALRRRLWGPRVSPTPHGITYAMSREPSVRLPGRSKRADPTRFGPLPARARCLNPVNATELFVGRIRIEVADGVPSIANAIPGRWTAAICEQRLAASKGATARPVSPERLQPHLRANRGVRCRSRHDRPYRTPRSSIHARSRWANSTGEEDDHENARRRRSIRPARSAMRTGMPDEPYMPLAAARPGAGE
jgi:hypothetical protein